MKNNKNEKKTAITFRLCATIHFNRPVNNDTDYIVPGGYTIVLANGNSVQFDFEYSEWSIASDGCSIRFMQKNPDYAAFEDLDNLTIDDLRNFKEFDEFYVYLGEGNESPGLEVTKITDACFQVISDENGKSCHWFNIDIPDEKFPQKAYR